MAFRHVYAPVIPLGVLAMMSYDPAEMENNYPELVTAFSRVPSKGKISSSTSF